MKALGGAFACVLATAAGPAAAQIGATNNSNNSPLVGSRYDDNANNGGANAVLDAAASGRNDAGRDARSHHRARAAKPSDVVAGARVSDASGQVMGTIAAVSASGAVVDTGTARAEVPIDAFGKDDGGLLLQISKAKFEAAAAGGASR